MNPDILIPLVEERPEIWDHRIADYKNKQLKRDAWMDICRIIYPKKQIEDEDMCKVKSKWTRLRDCHQKALKRLGNVGDGSSPHKYKHYDKMKFLLQLNRPRVPRPALVDPDAETVMNARAHTTNEDWRGFQTNPEQNLLSRIMYNNLPAEMEANEDVEPNNEIENEGLAEMDVNEDVTPAIEESVTNANASSHCSPIDPLPRIKQEDQRASTSNMFGPSTSAPEVIEIDDDIEIIPNESNNPIVVKVEEESIFCAIILESYPECKLSEEQGTTIQMAINHKLQMHIKEVGTQPLFTDSYIERGAVIMKCSNEMTREWLDKLVKADFMPLGDSLKLMVGLSKDILKPNRVLFKAPAELSKYTQEEVFGFLDNQNPTLKIGEWNVLSENHEPGFRSFVCSVNDECLHAIKLLNCMVHVSLWKVSLATDDSAGV